MFRKDDHIEAILEKARVAADEAGDKWLAENTKPRFAVYNADLLGRPTSGVIGTMLDNCGGAYIACRDKRSRFFRYMTEREKAAQAGIHDTRFFRLYFISVNHKNRMRQEHGLHKAAAAAYLEVLKQHNLAEHLYVKDYID